MMTEPSWAQSKPVLEMRPTGLSGLTEVGPKAETPQGAPESAESQGVLDRMGLKVDAVWPKQVVGACP